MPVLGVPMKSDALNGLDRCCRRANAGGNSCRHAGHWKAGAINAGCCYSSPRIARPELRKKLKAFRKEQEKKIIETILD